jgi:hypothetical protein
MHEEAVSRANRWSLYAAAFRLAIWKGWWGLVVILLLALLNVVLVVSAVRDGR